MVAAGGIASADTAKIPTKGGKIKLCYNEDAAEELNGGAGLRIYDPKKNDDKCKKGDDKLTLDPGGGSGDDPNADLDSEQKSATALLLLTSAANYDTPTAIPGLSFSLPKDGVYSVSVNAPTLITITQPNAPTLPPGGGCGVGTRLTLNGVAVPDSERLGATQFAGGPNAVTAAVGAADTTQLVNTDGPATLGVEAALRCGNPATFATIPQATVAGAVSSLVAGAGPGLPADLPISVASWTLINED